MCQHDWPAVISATLTLKSGDVAAFGDYGKWILLIQLNPYLA
jgi:hypothetical protein